MMNTIRHVRGEGGRLKELAAGTAIGNQPTTQPRIAPAPLPPPAKEGMIAKWWAMTKQSALLYLNQQEPRRAYVK